MGTSPRSPFEDPDNMARVAEILNRGYARHVAEQADTLRSVPAEVAAAALRRAAASGVDWNLEEALDLVEQADEITWGDNLVVVIDGRRHGFDVGAPLTGL